MSVDKLIYLNSVHVPIFVLCDHTSAIKFTDRESIQFKIMCDFLFQHSGQFVN